MESTHGPFDPATLSTTAAGDVVEYAMRDHRTGKAEYVRFDHGTAFNACAGCFCWKQDPSAVHTFKIG